MSEAGHAAAAANQSASVNYYVHHAIAPSTRRTYQHAIEQYHTYCHDRGWNSNDPITIPKASEWLAAVADQGQVRLGTMRTYRAALSTHFEETSTNPTNPLSSPHIARLMNGIERDKAPREAEVRREKPKTEGVTMEMLKSILLHKPIINQDHCFTMCFGAAVLASVAGLRPNELLGNTSIESDRALKTTQIKFFLDLHDELPMSEAVIRNMKDTHSSITPDHFTITLTISKTNQLGNLESIHVGDEVAVAAVWRWKLLRIPPSQDQEHGPEFFKLIGYRPLRMATLLKFVETNLVSAGHKRMELTGKCFRIGRASELAAAGASEEQLTNSGGWAHNSRTWRIYADGQSKKVRDVQASKKK